MSSPSYTSLPYDDMPEGNLDWYFHACGIRYKGKGEWYFRSKLWCARHIEGDKWKLCIGSHTYYVVVKEQDG